ncbi:MAG: glutamyl-tRNA reductase [Anaerolineaceae bacterium]|nr:MAG: glutamyl-tRNA reductase [Anaerolineaceae bacterium]
MESAQIALIGLSYRTSPIVIREQLSCSVATLPPCLLGPSGRFPSISEIAILSTCNRVELYAAVEPHLTGTQELLATLLAEITGVNTAVFAEHTYFHTDLDAADHLLRVATGLESLVLGEPQILGQVTNSYMNAIEGKTIGPVLTELFRAAIRSGKRARTDTNISHNPMSTSTMAIAQAQKLVGDLTHLNCLIIGLGEMGRLAFKRLQARGVQHISLVNRTYERAASLAGQNGHVAYRWDDLPLALTKADIVISATSATQAVISADDLRHIMADRPHRPLILLDIAVPRDISPDVGQIPGVTLWDADQLKGSLDEALAARQQEVPKVEQIIAAESETLMAQLRMLAVKPVIVNLREKAENIRQHELERMLNHLGEVDAETMQQLQYFSRSLVNKLLHDPTIRLKIRASHDEANTYAAAISDLFALDPQPAAELKNS